MPRKTLNAISITLPRFGSPGFACSVSSPDPLKLELEMRGAPKARTSSRFAALQDSSDSSEEEDGGRETTGNITQVTDRSLDRNPPTSFIPAEQSLTFGEHHPSPVLIPPYDDISASRADEETVLQAVYMNDFRRHAGVSGYPRFEVDIRPPDVKPDQIGSQLWYVGESGTRLLVEK